jgi:hypothetical protein
MPGPKKSSPAEQRAAREKNIHLLHTEIILRIREAIPGQPVKIVLFSDRIADDFEDEEDNWTVMSSPPPIPAISAEYNMLLQTVAFSDLQNVKNQPAFLAELTAKYSDLCRYEPRIENRQTATYSVTYLVVAQAMDMGASVMQRPVHGPIMDLQIFITRFTDRYPHLRKTEFGEWAQYINTIRNDGLFEGKLEHIAFSRELGNFFNYFFPTVRNLLAPDFVLVK